MPTRINFNRRQVFSVLVGAVTVGGLLPGCFQGSAAGPVDPPVALEALRVTLEAWKREKPIDSLESGSPQVVAQDLDWLAGLKLVDYQVEGDGKENDVNLRVPVKLTLKTLQGKQVKKNVTYVIGTSPAVTVFRDFP